MSLFALIAMKPTVGAGGSLRKSCISLMPRHLSVDGAAALPCVIGYHSTYAKNLIHEGLSYVFPEQHKDIEETSHVELAVSMVESGSACTLILAKIGKSIANRSKKLKSMMKKAVQCGGSLFDLDAGSLS